MLDLHVGDLDAPGIGLLVENFLDIAVELIAFRQHLIQLMLPQNRSQCGLRQLTGGLKVVFHMDHRPLGIDHAEVNHRVDPHRHVVA